MLTHRTMLPSALKLEVAPEEIINTIDDPVGKKITTAIFNAFISNKLRYKATAQWHPKDSVEPKGYTVHFIIKGGKDAVIICTRNFGGVQLRIKNWNTFDKLDEYSENIRNNILNGKPCQRCTPDGGKFMGHGEYVFVYHGKEYRKCQMLCGNFKLRNNRR
ncbi:MAG: hypothetical protein A2Y17_04905 [Clostridiales bacterium GWF2_38_85]|nr:MAG: hypothetical protein A2Y17_04905 [Clostridiales bacterium GWF2_38_85]HBL84373.1 hypothetical protein [Clostridiales bacterium]